MIYHTPQNNFIQFNNYREVHIPFVTIQTYDHLPIEIDKVVLLPAYTAVVFGMTCPMTSGRGPRLHLLSLR